MSHPSTWMVSEEAVHFVDLVIDNSDVVEHAPQLQTYQWLATYLIIISPTTWTIKSNQRKPSEIKESCARPPPPQSWTRACWLKSLMCSLGKRRSQEFRHAKEHLLGIHQVVSRIVEDILHLVFLDKKLQGFNKGVPILISIARRNALSFWLLTTRWGPNPSLKDRGEKNGSTTNFGWPPFINPKLRKPETQFEKS